MVYFIRLTFNEQKEFHLFMNIEHSYPFDPTNGMTQEELLAVAPGKEPEGFREFWEENFALVANAPLKYNVETEVWSPVPEEKIYRVRVTNYDGVEFVTWITRPANSQGALVIGQGYGNIATASASKHSLTVTYTAVRGLGPSQCKDIPWQPSAHVLYGIDSKENYILRGVIADQWMTLRVLLDMFPDCAGNINYSGGSMGGGMGALLLPWEKRFKAAFLHVPTFGAEIRFDYESTGSGEACRKYILEHPEARRVLRYFDASVAARYIKIPVCCTPALFDPCVAPAGQFSVVNAIAEEYKTVFIRETGHFSATERDKEVEKEADIWCSEHFCRRKSQ